MKGPLIDIAAEIRRDDPRNACVAIADGTPKQIVDRQTGEQRTVEKWFWIPRHLIEDNGDGTVTLPEWLAHKEGLI